MVLQSRKRGREESRWGRERGGDKVKGKVFESCGSANQLMQELIYLRNHLPEHLDLHLLKGHPSAFQFDNS